MNWNYCQFNVPLRVAFSDPCVFHSKIRWSKNSAVGSMSLILSRSNRLVRKSWNWLGWPISVLSSIIFQYLKKMRSVRNYNTERFFSWMCINPLGYHLLSNCPITEMDLAATDDNQSAVYCLQFKDLFFQWSSDYLSSLCVLLPNSEWMQEAAAGILYIKLNATGISKHVAAPGPHRYGDAQFEYPEKFTCK